MTQTQGKAARVEPVRSKSDFRDEVRFSACSLIEHVKSTVQGTVGQSLGSGFHHAKHGEYFGLAMT